MTEKKMTKGLIVAGLGGGSGKSVVAVSLAAHLGRQGRVVPFKKGPDYIDAGWLKLAAGAPCYNLDPYLMKDEDILRSFRLHAAGSDYVIIEGNRGLYDGVNIDGAYSTAELAKILALPVILVVDCTKTTRTVAAQVLGCREFDPQVDIRGVVLNRTGTARHEKIVREAVERYTDIPVVGAFPRQRSDIFPQRHLGVTPYQEDDHSDETVERLAGLAAEHIDLPLLCSLMADVDVPSEETATRDSPADTPSVRIGVLQDAVFQFYYPDNLEALANLGGEIVEINALTAQELPQVDALYIGGGFPETSAGELAANSSFRQSLKKAAENGLPIYAECGGLIYLGESIELDGEIYPLAGVFPARFSLKRKPQAHGYTVATVINGNPFYPPGTIIRGHEFRYSRVDHWDGEPSSLAMEMQRGVGFIEKREGLVHKNVLALYTHIHSISTPEWAVGLVAKAREFRGLRMRQ